MKSRFQRLLQAPLLGIMMLCCCGAVRAESFPSRALSLVVPFGPGGATDIAARMVASEASRILKEQVVIHNKPGASATIGTAEVFRAQPDGYTLLVADNISTAFQPLRMPLPYAGPEDFQPISKVANVPNVLVVPADSSYQTLDDLVDAARKEPGKIRVSTAGLFTGTDLNLRELNHLAGIDVEPVPVSGGTGAAVTLMLGGHVEGVVAAPAAVVSFVEAKKVRPLTVFSKERIDLFPDLPTTAELGYDTTMGVMLFISAPKGLDTSAVEVLQSAFIEAVGTPTFQDFAKRNGYQVDALGPGQLQKELADWRTYFVSLSHQLGIEKKAD